MKCKHRNQVNNVNFCYVACRYCTFQQETECKKKHPEYFKEEKCQVDVIDFEKVCKLYKRIMKRDSSAIDEIESLEDAKEIISMITSNLLQYATIRYIKECFKEQGV